MSTVRTFIAVNLSSKIRANAGACIDRLQSAQADYRWVAAENLHITVNFLGDVRDAEIPDLCQLIQGVVQPHCPFRLRIKGMGAFPSPSRPRVVWLGVEDQSLMDSRATPNAGPTTAARALTRLHQELSAMLRGYGFPKDRNEFNPHLTLGRLRRGGRWNQALTDVIQKHADYDAGSCEVDEVVVYSSHLDKTGPTYTAMSRIELLGEAQ